MIFVNAFERPVLYYFKADQFRISKLEIGEHSTIFNVFNLLPIIGTVPTP